MNIETLKTKATLYQISQMLKIKPPAVYKWAKTGKIPELRLYQLRELRPDWFAPPPIHKDV